MKFGDLTFEPVTARFELTAEPVGRQIQALALDGALVCGIDDSLSDTTAFCEHYHIGPEVSANCVVIEAKRADRVWYAACVILATTRADVNGLVRRHLDARRISFAPMDMATSMTGMEYGGITPIGLPADWPILIDIQLHQVERVVIGSGLRRSKLLVPGKLLASLPGTTVMNIIKETE
jgi:prolyl-tRNA editing enzyme YbaK/EbsC (Cys-tRNA(Pro) deacylase)